MAALEPTVDVFTPLKEKVEELRRLRNLRAEASATLDDLNQRYAMEHHAEFAAATDTSAAVTRVDSEVRQLALQYYAMTGDPAPCSGVLIKQMTALEYDDATALVWAISHCREALLLDRKKLADHFKRHGRPGFVREENKPTVSIAANLDKALADG